MNAIQSSRYGWDSLFSHQQSARDAVVAELVIADRTQVIMACGTGKSRVGPAIAFQRASLSVVVYLPSLALVRQMLPEWQNSDFGRPMSFLCVCSDETVKGDATVVTPEEIREEFGLAANSVTTDSAVVSGFLSAPSMAMRVVFCTYQSADTLAAGLPDGFRFDLGVFDEAHRTAGKHGMFTGPLQDSHTPIAKRVFMTATPKHVSLRKKNKDGEGQTVFSMDDEAVYGKVAYRLPLRQAIGQKLIADYKVLVSVVDDAMLPEGWQQKGIEAEPLAHAIALRNAMEKYGLNKVVTFHDSVAEAQSFASASFIQNELGSTVAMSHINGSMSSGLRGEIMEGFATSKSSVITNARCLTEGVDVPAIDLVAFLHPRKSHIDIIQAIGRALRLPRGSQKTTGYILLPLYVSQIDNGGLEKALEESGYDTVFQVVQALREQDEQVDTFLREAVWKRTEDKDAKIEMPFIEIDGNAQHLDLLRQAIGVRCLESTMESWEAYYGVLKRRFDRGEDVNVPIDMEIDGLKVGRWSDNQRQAKKAGTLSAERIARLDAIGFVWEVLDAQWEANIARLEALHAAGQDVNVPRCTEIDGLKVGQWSSDQRKRKRSGTLSAERVTRLDAIGFVWDVLDAQWEAHMSRLEARHAAGQVVNVLQDTEIDGLKVGTWSKTQRQARKAGRLSAERIARLDAVGFVWEVLDAQWEAYIACLEARHAAGQDVNAPKGTVIDGLKVGTWSKTQRQARKAGRLSAERIARLDAVGFVWEVLDAQWEAYIACLEARHAAGQDVNAPKGTVIDGLQVGQWSGKQRTAKKAGRLSADRIARLDAIGFVWEVLDAQWEAYIACLEARHAAGQDVNVSQDTKIEGLKVGFWSDRQRKARKAGTLSAERISRLDAIGFKWSLK